MLAHPCDPTLHEDYVASARDYVGLAEQANGPIPRRAEPSYVWGAALDELNRMRPDARIINLETAITRSDDYARKGINYRMNPENADWSYRQILVTAWPVRRRRLWADGQSVWR